MGLFSRKLRKDLAASRAIDTESEKIWEAFRRTEEPICCKAARQFISRGGVVLSYEYTRKDDSVIRVDVQVKYCIGCGRKLI